MVNMFAYVNLTKTCGPLLHWNTPAGFCKRSFQLNDAFFLNHIFVFFLPAASPHPPECLCFVLCHILICKYLCVYFYFEYSASCFGDTRHNQSLMHVHVNRSDAVKSVLMYRWETPLLHLCFYDASDAITANATCSDFHVLPQCSRCGCCYFHLVALAFGYCLKVYVCLYVFM